MAFSERLALIITANADQAIREIRKVGNQAEKDLGKAESKVDKFASSSLKIGAGLVAAGGVALPMLARLGQGASDLNEQISGSTVVFRENAAEVQEWSGNLAGSFGISQRAALTAGNNFGAMFSGLGIAGDEATEMSKRLVELAADLASFKNLSGGAEEALERLRSGLAGEAEPLRRMDIFLNEAAVSAKAAELGIAGLGDKLTDSQKVQARYALILEQTALAQGDFARTSDSLANSQRIAAAEAENAKNAFGQGVVGPMTAATQAVGGLVSSLGELSPELASTVGGIATLTAATSVGVGALALLSGGVIKAGAAFKTETGSLNNFGKAAKGLGVVAGVAGTIFAIKGSLDALGLSARGLELDLQDLARTTDQEFAAAFVKLRAFNNSIANELFNDLPLDQQQRLVNALKETGEKGWGYLEARVKTHAKAQADAAASTAAAEGALHGLTGATEDNAEATEDSTEVNKDAAKAAKDLADQRERILDATLDSISAELAYANSFDSLRDAQTDVAVKQQAYNDALKAGGKNSGAALHAAEELADAQRDLVGEYLSTAESAQRLAQSQAEAQGKTFTAADGYRVYRDELIKLKDQLAPGSTLRVHLEDLINKLPPPEVKFKVLADTAAAQAALDALTGPRTFGIPLQAGLGGRLRGKFHTGGVVPGSPGEEVPILARAGERVTPVGQSSGTAAIVVAEGAVQINVSGEPDAFTRVWLEQYTRNLPQRLVSEIDRLQANAARGA